MQLTQDIARDSVSDIQKRLSNKGLTFKRPPIQDAFALIVTGNQSKWSSLMAQLGQGKSIKLEELPPYPDELSDLQKETRSYIEHKLLKDTMVEYGQRKNRHHKLWDEAHTLGEKFSAIRKIYDDITPEILKAFNAHPSRWIDPYFFDWIRNTTPIEDQAWWAIRTYANIPMYPQFPVGKYFLDFGHPGIKIGLEADGKDFHDPVKDRARDKALAEMGWTIFRVTGKECNARPQEPWEVIEAFDYEDSDEFREALYEANKFRIFHSVEGVCEAIKAVYFEPNEPVEHELMSMYRASLDEHCHFRAKDWI